MSKTIDSNYNIGTPYILKEKQARKERYSVPKLKKCCQVLIPLSKAKMEVKHFLPNVQIKNGTFHQEKI